MLCGCSEGQKNKVEKSSESAVHTTEKHFEKSSAETEMRAVWISCYELPDATVGEESFRLSITEMFKKIKDFGLNTVFLHVRPFADAIYPSEFFPWSKYACRGENPGFDPLAVVVNCAKEASLSLHAWINPFRVSMSSDVSALPKDSPAKALSEKNTGDVAILSNGIYFNPSSTEVHSLVYGGVREILEKYDVDGIHIDDYFYPCADEEIDRVKYEQYKKAGGTESLAAWRRDSVSAFAAGLYSLVKSYGEDKVFSISPAGNISLNESKLFADVNLWMSCTGYADVVIPQVYFGFENGALPFKEAVDMWSKSASCEFVKIVWGLAPYKCGEKDEIAGEGIDEWIENSDILSRQLLLARESKRYDGFALFSYSYIFLQKNNENLKKEMQLLKNML